MKYNTIISGQFVSRPNRFIAQVQVDGAMQTVHVKNTGRCKRCLPIRKHRGAREKRYSFGYAVFLILALMK